MNERKFVTALARGMSILRSFRVSDDGLTHAQIVERTGLSPATVTRLTYTLKETGYLSQNGNLLRYGPAAIAMASVVNTTTSFLDLISVALQDLADDSRTLVLMAVRDSGSMSLARTWRPRGAESIWLEQGNRVPLVRSSTGRAFLAALDPSRFEAMNPDEGMRKQREAGIEQLSRYGFVFVNKQESFAKTVSAVARPYYASDLGEPVVFCCGAVPQILSDTRIVEEVGPALCDVVRDLETKTGGARLLGAAMPDVS